MPSTAPVSTGLALLPGGKAAYSEPAKELSDINFGAEARREGRGSCDVWSSGAGNGRYTQHIQWWMPNGQAVGTVFLFHGMYEHAGRYDHVASEFVKHGFSVYAPDHRGHGRTEGGRGEIDTFDDFVNDGINLIEAVDASQKNIPGRKLFLFGHSMGGAIAARIAQVRPKLWAGVILSGPGLGVGVGHGCLLAILNVLRKCVPHAPFPPFDPSLVVGYAPSSKAYAEDELNYRGGPKLSLVYHMGRANQAVWRNAGAWTLPLLVVHGADDVVCPVKFSRRFVETVNSKSKTLKVYPGLKHEILNEAPASRELVLQDMCEWLRITSGEL